MGGVDFESAILSASEMAALLGITERRLQQLVDEGYVPRHERGAYQAGPAVRGYIRSVKESGGNRNKEHAALARAQAEKVRRENLRARGALQPVELVDETLQGVAGVIVPELEGLPGRVANELAGISEPGVIRARLQDECRAIRTSVADYLERRADTLAAMQDGGEHVAPAAEADAGAVGGGEPDIPGGELGAGPISQSQGPVVDPAAAGLRQPAL